MRGYKGGLRKTSIACGAIALVLAFGIPAGATSPGIVGTFDNTYGVDGLATAPGNVLIPGSMDVDAQGRIVVSGGTWNGSVVSTEVTRFTKAGRVDRTFGLNGTARIASAPSGAVGGTESAVAPDGRIVVVGYRVDPTSTSVLKPTTTVVARLTTTGRLDATFDGDGFAAPQPGRAVAVKIDGAGRAVVLGEDGHGSFIRRYLTNGHVDPTFGSGGLARITGPRLVELAVDATNRDVVAGSENGPSVARLTAIGALDASFGSGGVVRYVPWSSDVLALAIQADGRIVLTGFDSNHALSQVARLLANGTPDPGFGTHGVVGLARIAASPAFLNATEVPGGLVVVGGGATNTRFGADFGIAVRLRTNGSVDPTFACGGAAWFRVDGRTGNFVDATATEHDVYAMGFGGSNGTSVLTVSRLRLDPSVPGGYAIAASDGGTAAFGSAAPCPSIDKQPALARPVVGIATTPSGHGRWLVASDGGVVAAGDAHFYGSTGGLPLHRPIVGMASTPTGRGYWLVASDGGIFAFGDAHFHGSTGGRTLNRPIVGMASTPTGRGYWLVASDGGIFAFGDAHFYGSTGAMKLVRPVVGMAPAHSGNGYWLVASDGGIFSFGGTHFYGSAGAMHLAQPVVGMAATRRGDGYWLAVSGGGIFSFGAAQFHGGSAITPLGSSIVGIASTP